MSDLVYVTGLYKKKDKNDEGYLLGGIGFGANVYVFKNKYKNKKTDPDYKLAIGKKEMKEQGQVKEKANNNEPDNPDIPF